MENEKIKEIVLVNEELLEEKIYIIRGQKVMLDVDLAEIYGYETKRFNEQVKNNLERFDTDFRFRLTKEELENLRSKISTSSWGGSRHLPYAFTEEGIYMLMTILKGELAIKQSKALIRTFKRMKDFIIENQNLIGQREYLQLSMRLSDNISKTLDLRADLNEVEDQMADVMDRLSNVVVRSDLSEIMNDFGEPNVKREYLILNGQPFMADVAYDEIYRQAKKSIYVIDNYIGIKTLLLLINVLPDVEIKIFSDNLAKGLTKTIYEDFRKEYPNLNIKLHASGGIFHDRYIILDYGTENENVYHCGASSKDAGKKICAINQFENTAMIHSVIDSLLLGADKVV